MALGIFGRKRPLDRAKNNDWKNADEKDALIGELKEARVKPREAIGLLWSSDAGIRQVGVEKFLAGADAGAVDALFGQLPSQSRHAVAFVSRLVPRMPEDAVAAGLDKMVRGSDKRSQRLGWQLALEVQGASRDTWLVRAMDEGPSSVQVSAARNLVQDGKVAGQLERFLELARADGDLAAVALEAVQGIEDPRVVTLMIDRFAHGDAAARDRASRYLRARAADDPTGMRAQMLSLLGEGDDATRRLSVAILLETGDDKDVLLDILEYSKDLVGWLRTRILETVQTFGDRAFQPALDLLDHEAEHIRTSALVLAEQFDDPRVIPPVARLLQSDDWWLRITACDTLGRIGSTDALPHLVQALDDEDTRWAAIDALAQIGSPKALKHLSKQLRDKRPEVRSEIVRAFGRFDDKRLIPLLQQVIAKDPSSEVRTRAAEVVRDLSERLQVAVDGSKSEPTSAVRSDQLTRPIDKLLAQVREMGASDMHISIDEPPLVRVNGTLVRLEGWPSLSASSTSKAVLSLLSPKQRAAFQEEGELDLCYAIPEVGRYRTNAYVQRKGIGAAFRVIPNVPPTFSDIRLPGRLTELLDYHQGLIMVSGPASSGKSTTLAAIINLINESKSTHVITLEDPIEFVHPVKTALVNQREVGKHTESFERALRGALRQDPDVIMVGEMRDPETIRMALEASETGHLVIATMHTTSAVQTVERLIQSFPPEEQQQVRTSLSESLKWVVCQSLIPRGDGQGRVAVFELLKNTFSVGNLIRDEKTFQIPSQMQIGRRHGMQTVDMALEELVESQIITPETAWMRAEQPDTFAPLCAPGFIQKHTNLLADAEPDADDKEQA